MSGLAGRERQDLIETRECPAKRRTDDTSDMCRETHQTRTLSIPCISLSIRSFYARCVSYVFDSGVSCLRKFKTQASFLAFFSHFPGGPP